jgi:hypothetical protein
MKALSLILFLFAAVAMATLGPQNPNTIQIKTTDDDPKAYDDNPACDDSPKACDDNPKACDDKSGEYYHSEHDCSASLAVCSISIAIEIDTGG